MKFGAMMMYKHARLSAASRHVDITAFCLLTKASATASGMTSLSAAASRCSGTIRNALGVSNTRLQID